MSPNRQHDTATAVGNTQWGYAVLKTMEPFPETDHD
jgi:hypothetical protein